MKNAHKSLINKPEEKIPRGRPRHWYEDNVQMNL